MIFFVVIIDLFLIAPSLPRNIRTTNISDTIHLSEHLCELP